MKRTHGIVLTLLVGGLLASVAAGCGGSGYKHISDASATRDSEVVCHALSKPMLLLYMSSSTTPEHVPATLEELAARGTRGGDRVLKQKSHIQISPHQHDLEVAACANGYRRGAGELAHGQWPSFFEGASVSCSPGGEAVQRGYFGFDASQPLRVAVAYGQFLLQNTSGVPPEALEATVAGCYDALSPLGGSPTNIAIVPPS